MLSPLLLLCVAGLTSSMTLKDKAPSGCGYDSCVQAEKDMLNVHIVPHTHDDVGWLKTVDQYYYGSRNDIQKAGVQYILDSVIKELWQDAKRRFIYVETAFFWKWWTEQSEEIRSRTRELVRQGRLQFVGGAWSMNDEAASHYQSTIDQFTKGLRKLNETFGPCATPHVGWQIDPFGHSREFASLLAAMGYDGLFLGRIDYQDKRNRLQNRTMEMLWRGDDDLGKSSDIFTGILYNTYSPPPGFCFDILCSDEPIIDDADSPMFNVDQRITEFLKYIDQQSKMYLTNNVIVTMGGDFTYQDATMWYKNLDKLIKYTNLKAAQEGLNIKLFYSTPNCYLKAVRDANPSLPSKKDDFFPYASDPNSYWTGYFTSRPTTKYFERQGNGYLQMVKQLQVLTQLEEHNSFVLHELEDAMGKYDVTVMCGTVQSSVMQHHDAITGTEKQHVTHDYERILDAAIDDANLIARQAFNKILQGDALKPPLLKYNRCRLNESSCHTSENSQQFIVTVYNALAWEVKEPIRIPVKAGRYEVYAPNGEEITSQLYVLPPEVLSIPTRVSEATHEIVFIAYLKPVSFKSYYVKKHDESNMDIVSGRARRSIRSKRSPNLDLYEQMNLMLDGRKRRRWQPPRQNDFSSLEEKERFFSSFKKEMEGKSVAEKAQYVREQPQLNRLAIFKRSAGPESKQEADPTFPYSTDRYFDEVLKNGHKDGLVSASELEKLVREVLEKSLKHLHDRRDENYTVKKDVSHLTTLSEEERRMLSDEPYIATLNDDFKIGFSDNILLHFSTTQKDTLQLNHVTLPDGTDVKFNMALMYYPGCAGNNTKAEFRASGAYIFRPNATRPVGIDSSISRGPTGEVFQELRLKTNTNAAAFIRVYKELKFLEVEWIIGPINIEDDVGKEFIVKYQTDLINNGEFYTDSNGRQMLKRTLNKRPQWNLTLEEPVAGNYYPVTNKIFIKDDKVRFSVLTDRSEGGSSLEEGSIELMLHRRLLHDDAFGVGEALNETALGKGLVARGRQRILFSNENVKQQYIDEKKQVLEYHLEPKVFVSDAKDVTIEKWMNLSRCQSWLNELPEGLHLLTLEPWENNSLLLRLENYLEKSDKEITDIDIDLRKIFKSLKLLSLKEATLAANQWIEDDDKWSWNTLETVTENVNDEKDGSPKSDNVFKIKIKAKEIKTFVINYDV